MARRVSSHNGRFKYSDSFAFSSEHNVPKIVSACGRVISSDTKRRILDNEDRSTRISKARGALLQYFDDSEHWKHCGSVDQAEYQTAGGICPSNEDEPTQEWVYDEVYFQTTADRAEIEANIDRYWELGSDWSPAVPMTDKEMIAKLQEELQEAKADLTQARTDSDMAIAELTIVLATMMAPTV